jgi:hypothetical protein
VVAIYVIGGYFASLTGAKNINASAINSFFYWMQDFNYQKFKILIEFFIRGLIGQITVIAVFIGWFLATKPKKFNSLFWIIVFMSLSVWIQPILAGPEVAGSNIVRLCIYSFPGLVVALAIAIKDNGGLKLSFSLLFSTVFILFLISLHHRWSFIGAMILKTPEIYAIWAFGLSFILGLIFYISLKGSVRAKNV